MHLQAMYSGFPELYASEPAVHRGERPEAWDRRSRHAARRHPIRVFELDDLTMIIGGDRTGRPLEVGVVRSEEGVEFVVHAMTVRPKFLR